MSYFYGAVFRRSSSVAYDMIFRFDRKDGNNIIRLSVSLCASVCLVVPLSVSLCLCPFLFLSLSLSPFSVFTLSGPVP